MTPQSKLDTNRAWQSAQAAIKGNREPLLAIAGVFFFLPSLAFALLYPPPPPTPAGMTFQQSMEFAQKFYLESFPATLAMTIIQIVGIMAVLRLFTGPNRPTVGDAIGKGVVDAIIFLGAALLIWAAWTLGGGLLVALAVATGQSALAALAAIILLGALLYLVARFCVILPVIAVEGLRRPVAALRRAWVLTRGNAARIGVFLLLLTLVYFVILFASTAVGLALALVLGAAATKIVLAGIVSALSAIYTLYVFTSLAAIHRQLAGPTPAEIGATFD